MSSTAAQQLGERQPGPSQQAQPPYHRIWRQHGETLKRTTFTSAGQLRPWDAKDFDMIVAPLDGTRNDSGTDNGYQTLVNLYEIPDEFVWEREQSVTHSFGRRIGDGGRMMLWMHFLVEIPRTETPERQPDWLKWGFLLSWRPKVQARIPDCHAGPSPEPVTEYTIELIVFQPPIDTFKRLFDFVRSAHWTDATFDPYVLVDIALVSWYHRIDRVAWTVTELIRKDEVDIFERARMLPSIADSTVTDLDLHRIHTNAKNAIFMIEALDAAIRIVDLALSDHELSGQGGGGKVWQNTHLLLQHRRELFHSTRLRTVSSQARIKNTVDLAFHINTAHDSRVNLANSKSVRLISIVGLVFLPFSTITSIFGTQFFTSGDQHMSVNPDFWLLWLIAVPVTLLILGVWRAGERDTLKWPFGSAELLPLPSWRPAARKGAGATSRGTAILADGIELRNMEAQIV
ncbi:uncharacterized protein B0T15DRAFT_520372 [Chaetomium strumarium]|uniref:Uncharacterized protein n=1 Tax=Chaetomium strumarium TaxID=1170767 RepID=A0AAJ0H3F6_9PEZI|nr:hypothetical protein B0T15DRAFT_520372 [Chaetomium strumarium]